MHPKNPYSDRYDLRGLSKRHPPLEKYISLNPTAEETIDFSLSEAVYELNKALLLNDFQLEDYRLPNGYLIPPIPGRLDYLLHIEDFLSKEFKSKSEVSRCGLDIGAGANGIYCILGAQHFKWDMVGTECDAKAVSIAKSNIEQTKMLRNKVDIRHQPNKGFLLKNVINPQDQFDFSVCNPPFHASREEAEKGSIRKLKNLQGQSDKIEFNLNFEGQSNELWCNGGEVLFIKRLIKESVHFKDQVKVFSSLVSRSENLPKIKRQLIKLKANSDIIPMTLGNKKSRIVLWWYR